MKNPGRLSEVIDIRRKSFTFDGYGQPVAGSNTDLQVWAEVIHPGSAAESVKASQIYPERSVTFVIRHPNPTDDAGGNTLNESDTILYDGVEHNIIGIAPIGRRDGLTIYCKRKGTHDV
jgi:SPP1 family predicted phage head-tail adaptor